MANEWSNKSLDALGRIVTGKTPPSTIVDAFGGNVPFVTPSDMDGTRIISDTARTLSASGQTAVKNTVIPKNAVMVSCIGSDMGKAALAGADCITNQQINSIVIDTDDSPLFVYYNLSTRKSEIRGAASGSAQPILNKSAFGRLEIELPPPEEQRAIAHILGTLDDKIELLRKQNETLEAMARTLFKAWFVDFEPVRTKMEGCWQRGESLPGLPAHLYDLFPERLAESELGEIPEGWATRPVGDFAVLTGGKQLEREQIAPVGDIPVFGGAGVMGYAQNYNADGFVIAVGRVGAYCGQFFSHRGKAWINNNASLIRQRGENLGEWLFLSLRHADIDVIKKGAAQPFVSNGDIAKLPVIWPGEQMVQSFSALVVPILMSQEDKTAESKSLAQLRDTLLPKLISGELRVPDAEAFLRERGL